MDWDQFCSVVDSSDCIEHVELQGEGEPLMHPRFFDMISYIHSKHPLAKISFITNGSLFTQENIDAILDSAINKIFVSIESADESEFQKIRGGKLARVKRGISALVAAKKSSSKPAPIIGFAITVLKSTVVQIPAISALYHRLGLDGGLTIQPLQRMDCYTRYYQDDMLSERLESQHLQSLRQLIASDRQTREILATRLPRTGFYRDLQHSVAKPGVTCAWLENGLFISANGTACSCCFIKDANRDGFEKMNTENIAEIKRRRLSLLSTLRSGVLPGQCKDCPTAITMLQSKAERH